MAYLNNSFAYFFPLNCIKLRFAINFFTSIGLGGITEDLRFKMIHTCTVFNMPNLVKPSNVKMKKEMALKILPKFEKKKSRSHLKSAPKPTAVVAPMVRII